MSRYPWRDTSSDIAGGQPPQWETPQGAQVKVDTGLEDFAAMPETGLADASITTKKIRDGNIVESKIADQAVTQAKIASGAITNEKLAPESVDTNELKIDSVTTSKIKDESVVTEKIKDQSVTLNKMSSESIDAANHTYSGSVAASTVAEAIDTTSNRVEYFITHSGDSVVEIVDARIPDTGTPFNKLGDRLNDADAKIQRTLQGKPATGYRVIAGVIRNTGSGWAFIEDATHAKTGLVSISASGYNITINYDFVASKVSSLVVTPDETTQLMGLCVGSSVGSTLSIIQMSMPFSGYFTGAGAISGLMSPFVNTTSVTLSSDGSGFTVFHSPAVSIADVPSLTVLTETSSPVGIDVRANWQIDRVIITAHADLAGYIFWNGTEWEVQTDNVAKPTMAYNASTGVLTVTHQTVPDLRSLAISERGVSRPTINTSGVTSFALEFRNPDGTIITGSPTNDMRFFYARPGAKVPSKMPTSTRVGIRRGNVKIPVNDFVSASGNLWIYGVMEV